MLWAMCNLETGTGLDQIINELSKRLVKETPNFLKHYEVHFSVKSESVV